MQVITKFFLALLMGVLTFTAHAQIQQARGQYTTNYKDLIGLMDRKEAPTEVKQKARLEAAIKSVEAYYAEAGQSESANFDAIREKILSSPDRYILDTTIISENDDVKNFQYSVVVRASLNVANLRNAVQANSAVAKASESEKSALSFVFVSRQVDSVKSFDDRVYKRADQSIEQTASQGVKATMSEKTTEGESVRRSQVSTHGSVTNEVNADYQANAKVSVTSETGGSTVKRASESTWRVLPSADLNQVFISQFSQAGYDVIESAMVESEKFKVSEIEKDYKSGNDLQPTTLRAIAAGMKEAQIPYIALGTLDVGLPDTDPQTGLVRVSVTVNAKIWDVTKPIPRTRAAVGPVAYAGLGPTESEARASALKLAASKASQELSSRMTTMGMR